MRRRGLASLYVWASLMFCLFAPLGKALAEDYLFKYEGKNYKKEDLPPAAQQAFYEAEKARQENYSRVVEAFLLEKYVGDQAKKLKKSVEAVQEELFKVKEVNEVEAKAWYDSNKEAVGGRDFNSLKPEIMHYMQGKQVEKVRGEILDRIKKSGALVMQLPELQAPKIEIAHEGFPSKGAAKSKVTIIEFADYMCPHCRKASFNLKSFVEKNKDRVKLVYLDFPLSQNGVSKGIAEAAYCADKQGKFWEFHYMAFENQTKLNAESPLQFAKTLKLKVDDFKACMGTEDAKKRVEKARAEGERVGVAATPSIYVNGVKINGYSEEALLAETEKALGTAPVVR
ncbi:MAG: thioredoxin domain-containing protein [Oligoflexales bacterium]|nr:thioredoxin domain-containing protein [Oligoflexales bacterium]